MPRKGGSRVVRDNGPNWGLAFGSASFLIVWLLGFLNGLSIEVIALRSCVATIMGSLVGILFGQVLQGIKTLKDEQAKGQKVDFTLPAEDDELTMPLPGASAETLSSVVPQASSPATPAPSKNAAEAFQPLDFKQAARQIQNTMKE
jgi:hypothetical protein